MSATESKARTGTAGKLGAGRPLRPSEWDFERVPQKEREACYLYEYAREFSKTSQFFQKLYAQRHNRKMGFLAELRAMDFLQAHCPNFPNIHFEYFPATPWQDLADDWPVARRKVNLREWLAAEVNRLSERQREKSSDRIHIETVGQCAPANIRTLEAFQDYHKFFHHEADMGNTEYGFFAINWDFKNAQVVKAFTHWLNDQRKECEKLGHEPRRQESNRGGIADKLRRLGALRVVNHYRFKDLVDNADKSIKVDAPYCHYPDLSEAANRAKLEVTGMFPREWDERAWQRHQKHQSKIKVSLPDFLK